jgi:uncharacterized protein VirK/YbjX
VESLKQVIASSVSILKLTRKRDRHYAFQHGHVVWTVAANLRTQIEIFRALALPGCRNLALTDPRFPFKYVISNYLARGLTPAERAACFLHHYRRLNALMPASLLRQTLQEGLTAFEAQIGGCHYSITMGLATGADFREGELSLELRVDNVRIYVLQFTVVPGAAVRSNAQDVVLVSRLQGVRGCYPQIYSATKAFYEVAPPALLIGALHGVARAFGIAEWAGVSADNQTCYGDDHPDMFNTAYDEFFSRQGATRSSANFFVSPVPFEEKPLAQVKNGHKARKKKRRAIRLHLANEVCELILQKCQESWLPAAQTAADAGAESRSRARSAA